MARLNLSDISKSWDSKDCTWDIQNCVTLDRFPWKFGDTKITTTYANNKQGFHQQYGKFRAKFQMQEGWCWWLLQLEGGEYLEIDHFETFEKNVGLCSWRNKHFNSQRRVPNRDLLNPKFEGYIPFMREIYSRILFKDKKIREYILSKPRRFEIIWRKRFIMWKVDGWPCGIMFSNIPRQAMFPVLSGPSEIQEMQIKL